MSASWQPVDGLRKLADGEVQVWRIDLEKEAAPEEEYLRLLSAEEVERAGRLRAGVVRMQFLVGRSFLRRLLAAELEIAPRDVPLVAGEYGKPELGVKHGGSVHFNVSHAKSTVLVAVSRAGVVGIDIEHLDRRTDVEEVAHHAMTPWERSEFLAIEDPQERRRAFFSCWTRKEAVIKADGRGLSLPLNSFEVPGGVVCRMSPVEVPGAGGGPARVVFLSDIACEADMACALATSGPLAEVRLLRLATALPLV